MAGEREFDIPDTGAVFTFGRSRFADNVSSHFYIRNDPVVEVACGDEHTAVICQKGRVFMFGNNDYGQLGLGHKNVIVKPSCVKSLKPEKALHVACGRAHTLISTESGKVFAWGSNSDGQLGVGNTEDQQEPVEVVGISSSIVQLSAGSLSSAALTENGSVYVWGSNSDGQLGLADKTESVLEPVLLPFDHHVVHISCGYYHMALVTDSGALYTCGESETGKLGLPDSVNNITPPQKVPIAAHVKSVACGGNHTVVLTEDGEVFAFGNNFNGQLGLGKESTQSVLPMRVTVLEKHVIKSASCGESHTAFITRGGQLFTCGEGRHGKLCNDQDFSISQTIPIYIIKFRGFVVQKVACGGCHTMVLACRKDDDASSLDSDSYNLEDTSVPSQTPLPPLQRVPVITSPVDNVDVDPGDESAQEKHEINGCDQQVEQETQNGANEQENEGKSISKDGNNGDSSCEKLSAKSERSRKKSAGLSMKSEDLSLKTDENEDAESLSNKSSHQERGQSSEATGIVENSEPEEDNKETDDIKESAKNGSNGSEEDIADVKTEKAKAQGPMARFFSSLRRRSAKQSSSVSASKQSTNFAGMSAKVEVQKELNEESKSPGSANGKRKACNTDNKVIETLLNQLIP